MPTPPPLTVAALASWLAGLPHANPPQLLAALAGRLPEIAGVADPDLRLDLLDQLRVAAHTPNAALSGRCLRKPLPLAADEEQTFRLLSGFWLEIATQAGAAAEAAPGSNGRAT